MFKLLSALGLFIKRNVIVSFILYLVIMIGVPFFTSWIHKDLVEHFTLIDKKEYLSLALILKWSIIILTITICSYRIFSLFKKDKDKPSKKLITTQTKNSLTPLEEELLTKDIPNPQDKLYAELKNTPKEKKTMDSDTPIEERMLTMELKSKSEIMLEKMKKDSKE